MSRTATAIAATATLVRGEIDQHVRVEFAVKVTDLAALLTAAEKAALSAPGANVSLLFGGVLTTAAGATLEDGSAYPAAGNMATTALTRDQIAALAAYLKAN